MKVYELKTDKRIPELGKSILLFIDKMDEPVIGHLQKKEESTKGIILTFASYDTNGDYNVIADVTHWAVLPLLKEK